MKNTAYVLLISTLFVNISAKSQGNPGASISPLGPPALPMFMEDIAGRPYSSIAPSDIEGSPFLLADWNWGAVKFKNGRFAKDIFLRFNIYNNQLYFKKGNDQLEFVTPVNEFMIGYMKEFDSVAVVYRSGYPATEKTSPETFFELLADGKFQLIKYQFKTIRSFKPYNQPERKQFADGEQLFAFVDGKMIKLKKDKDAIIEALPQYANSIKAILDSKKIKLKNEEGVAQLFGELNKEIK